MTITLMMQSLLLLLVLLGIAIQSTQGLGVPDVSVSLETGLGGFSGIQEALLDLYLPPTDSGNGSNGGGAGPPRPVVLVLPGGAYSTLSMYSTMQISDDYSSSGYAVAILYYRLPRSDDPLDPLVYSPGSEAIDDVGAALAHLTTNAAIYGIDGNNIVLSGLSAGGHLASLYGTTCSSSSHQQSQQQQQLPCPVALVLYFPWLLTGSKIQCAPIGTKYWSTTAYDECFPTELITPHTPPTILYYAMGDTITPEADMDDFAHALAFHRVAYYYFKVPSDRGHVILPFQEVAAISNGTLSSEGNYGELVEHALLLTLLDSNSSCTHCDNTPTNWMMAHGKTCEWQVDYHSSSGAAVCSSSPYWTRNKFCQQLCYDQGPGFAYAGDRCCPSSSPTTTSVVVVVPPPLCTPCDNVATAWMITHSKTCDKRVKDASAVEDVCIGNDWWNQNQYCRKSCFDRGPGYAYDNDDTVCC